jgi:tRNA(adenine34) deaminase
MRRVADDEDLMRAALAEAEKARDAGEVPVGAVVLLGDEIVGRGFNQPISACDPTAHAEIVALRDAAARIGNYRLTGAAMYVTVEPCLMCLGAMVHARVARLVYGTEEPKSGAVAATCIDGQFAGHNHRFAVVSGVLADDCRALVQEFFRVRR